MPCRPTSDIGENRTMYDCKYIPAQPCRAVPPSRSCRTRTRPRTWTQSTCRLQLGDVHRKPPRPGSWAVVDLSAGPRPRAPLDPGSRLCDGKDPENGEMEKWIFTSPTTSLAKSVRDWGPWLSRGSGRRFHYFGPERSILTPKTPSLRAVKCRPSFDAIPGFGLNVEHRSPPDVIHHAQSPDGYRGTGHLELITQYP